MRIDFLASRSKTRAARTLVLALFQIVSFHVTEGRSMPERPGKQSENPDINQVISSFTQSELELSNALDHYAYKWDILIQTLKDGKVSCEYHRICRIYLNSDGNPAERVLIFPPPSIHDLSITTDDLRDLSAPRQFMLEPANLSKYKLSYIGKEMVDGSDTYVFGVKPKAKEDLFDGKVWVSTKDLKVIKMHGKWEQQGGQRSPVMDFHRTLVDSHLFPSSISADENLSFPRAPSVHIRIEARFSDYIKLN